METLPIYDRTGAEVGTYQIDPAELAPSINKQLLHDVVVMYQANRRQGSAQTKSRSDVKGTTRKMYRQKGTGNARAGSRRTNIRRGGGHVFAKRPRDWSYRLPKKAVRLATRMALASKFMDHEVTLIDRLAFEAPKTREMASVVEALGLDGNAVLVALDQYDANVYRSARNIAGVEVLPVAELNALCLLRPKRLLMTTAALDAVRQRIGGAAAADQTAAEESSATATASGEGGA